MKNNTIKNISMSGILTAITILFGYIIHFPIGSAEVSLVVIPMILFPFFIPFIYAIFTTGLSVVLVDALTGWAAFSWISAIAYVTFMIIYFFFAKRIIIGKLMLFVALLTLMLVYFLLDFTVFGIAFAITDLIATSIQISISFVLGVILSFTVIKLNFNFQNQYT